MAAQLAAGSTFADYRIEELVGRGGMGVVYRATDLRLDRPVALKLIAPERASDERFRERFLRESRLAASLGHPHVLPVFSAGEEDGQLFIAMRYVEGQDLKGLVAREGTLVPERALRICGQVAEALDAAHEMGLVHRDVKPANVLLDEREDCYLADFGLMKQLAGGETASASGQLVGTLDYLAPEQIRGEEVDGRSDQYALACVLYECLAGEPPFRRQTEAAVLWAHLEEVPPAIRDYPALDPVFARGLAKDREERFPGCAEFLDVASEALGLEAPRLGRRRLVRRSRILLLAGALVFAGALAALVVALTRAGEEPRPVAVQPNSVAAIDPETNQVVDDIPLGNLPTSVAVSEGAVWVLNGDDRTVSRIDLETRSVRTISVGGIPTDLTVGHGAVWVVERAGTVVRVDAQSGVVERTIRLPGLRVPPYFENLHLDIASARGAIWVSSWSIGPSPATDFVWRIDPVHGRAAATFRQIGGEVAIGGGAVWVAGMRGRLRIDTRTNAVHTIDASVFGEGRGISAAAGAGAVWITRSLEGTLSKIGFFSQEIERTITVGRAPNGVAVGHGSVWIANTADGTVVRIDPLTVRIVRTIRLGGSPVGIAVGRDKVWVTVA